MSTLPRQLLVGDADTSLVRWPALAVGLFATTFAGYALGVFEITGCVVFVPGHAALVGLLAAAVVGYLRGGVVFGWLVVFGALLGNRADHAFLGLSSRTRVEQAVYFLQFEGLVVYAVVAAVLGGLAFTAGALVRWGVDLRDEPA